MGFSGAVLTGGAGRRMTAGLDQLARRDRRGPIDDPQPAKALLVLAGRPMASYALAALREAGADEVLAIGGDEATGAALSALGFVFLADQRPGAGPLAAIVQALDAAVADPVVVLGCDTPLVSAATVRRLVEAAPAGGASVGTSLGRLEPLIAAYPKSARDALSAALASDAAAHRAVGTLGPVAVELDPVQGLNVNTPADLDEAERSLTQPLVDGSAAPSGGLKRRSTWPADGGR